MSPEHWLAAVGGLLAAIWFVWAIRGDRHVRHRQRAELQDLRHRLAAAEHQLQNAVTPEERAAAIRDMKRIARQIGDR